MGAPEPQRQNHGQREQHTRQHDDDGRRRPRLPFLGLDTNHEHPRHPVRLDVVQVIEKSVLEEKAHGGRVLEDIVAQLSVEAIYRHTW
jgi:hypothetical protein